MRAVLVGIDYVKDIDGSFKILELNTNIAIPNIDGTVYFESEGYKQFLLDNGITDVYMIFNQKTIHAGMYHDLDKSGTQPPNVISMIGVSTLQVEGVNYNPILLKGDEGIPSITDESTKLIIRQPYDSTALIDDSYARDNFQFLYLMYSSDSTSIPKTYINHPTLGFDTLDSIRDNGVHPNIIIKKRYPTTQYGEYPKLYKIDTLEELNSLKSSLPSDDILQEYIYNSNDLLNGKIKTYRTVDCLYGQLDILNMVHPFEQTNPMVVGVDCDFDDSKSLQVWERPKYIQKTLDNGCEKKLKTYICDDNNKILKLDNQLISPDEMVIGDVLKTVSLPGIVDTDDYSRLLKWSGDTQNILDNTSITGTTVQSIETEILNIWIKTITLDNGSSFSDVKDATVMVNNGGVTTFKKYYDLGVGDELIYYNSGTDSIETATITDVGLSYTRENVYLLDVEDIDIYMVSEENVMSPNNYLIQHNGPCTTWWFYIDTGCNLVGGDWGMVNGAPPDEYVFCNYTWFCGFPCGVDEAAYYDACQCRSYMEMTYNLQPEEACHVCRWICCAVQPESCYVTQETPMGDCQNIPGEVWQIDNPCGCIVDDRWDCSLNKGGWTNPYEY